MARQAPAQADGRFIEWSSWSASPAPIDASLLAPAERSALSRCGPGERGLLDAAQAVVTEKLQGLPVPETETLSFVQHARGEPHPWPRVWVATGRAGFDQSTFRELDAWLASTSTTELVPLRRCGVASGVSSNGTMALAVVAIDALADLAPIPTRVRTGQWVTVEARMLVPARDGKIVILGPSGVPRTVPTWFDGTTLRGRFAPESPGEHSLQVVANVAAGPRPVIEATILVDLDPSAATARHDAPGEHPLDGPANDGDGLARMLAEARVFSGMKPLVRDPRLDAIALAHAAHMARAHRLAHDVGDGDPLDRLHDAGLEPRDAGENVALASTIALAHRALWWSPSHRANMLRDERNRFGIGVIRDERGQAWAVELFASGLSR
jgi:hypothetical protein